MALSLKVIVASVLAFTAGQVLCVSVKPFLERNGLSDTRATVGGTIEFVDTTCTNTVVPPQKSAYCQGQAKDPSNTTFYGVIECLYDLPVPNGICNETACIVACSAYTPHDCLQSLANPQDPPLGGGCVVTTEGACNILSNVYAAKFTCDPNGKPAPPPPKPDPYPPITWTGGQLTLYEDMFCEYQMKGNTSVSIDGQCKTSTTIPGQDHPIYLSLGHFEGPHHTACQDKSCAILCTGFTEADCMAATNTPQGPFAPGGQCYEVPNSYCSGGYKPPFSLVELKNTPPPEPVPPHPGKIPPMVIVPGLTSSIIEYKLDNAEKVPLLGCNITRDWSVLYPTPPGLNLHDTLCYVNDLEVKIGEANGNKTYVPKRQGLSTRLLDFGGFNGFPSLAAVIPRYERVGWRINETLFGAPFDWRTPTMAQQDWFNDLQKLIQTAYEKNGGEKVVLFAVSLGPQFALGFLHRQSQAWKDKYIKCFIAVSPVFSGSVQSLLAFLDGIPPGGKNPGSIALGLEDAIIRSVPVASWLFPRMGNNEHTYNETDPLLITPDRNYSALDYAEMYKIMRLSQEFTDQLQFNVEEPDLKDFLDPGVDTWVSYGTGVPTPARGIMNEPLKDATPFISSWEYTSGDGIVPKKSSLRGTQWNNTMMKNGKKLYYNEYPGQQHAMCIVPPGTPGLPDHDHCFFDMLAYIINGTNH